MGLKFRYKSKEEILAEQVSLYAEREGEWVLDCDGVADKAKRDKSRNNNAALLKQIQELKRQRQYMWIGCWIDLNELKVPPNSNVQSGGEIERFVNAHKLKINGT